MGDKQPLALKIILPIGMFLVIAGGVFALLSFLNPAVPTDTSVREEYTRNTIQENKKVVPDQEEIPGTATQGKIEQPVIQKKEIYRFNTQTTKLATLPSGLYFDGFDKFDGDECEDSTFCEYSSHYEDLQFDPTGFRVAYRIVRGNWEQRKKEGADIYLNDSVLETYPHEAPSFGKVAFDDSGEHYAYMLRKGNEIVIIRDGKEYARHKAMFSYSANNWFIEPVFFPNQDRLLYAFSISEEKQAIFIDTKQVVLDGGVAEFVSRAGDTLVFRIFSPATRLEQLEAACSLGLNPEHCTVIGKYLRACEDEKQCRDKDEYDTARVLWERYSGREVWEWEMLEYLIFLDSEGTVLKRTRKTLPETEILFDINENFDIVSMLNQGVLDIPLNYRFALRLEPTGGNVRTLQTVVADDTGLLPFNSHEASISDDGKYIGMIMIERDSTNPLAERYYAVFDEKKSAQRYAFAEDIVLNNDGSHWMYRASEDREYDAFVVYDGKENLKYRGVEYIAFAPNQQTPIFVVRPHRKTPEGYDEWDHPFVVIGDRPGEPYDQIFPRFYFSPDNQYVAYGARKGNELWWVVERL